MGAQRDASNWTIPRPLERGLKSAMIACEASRLASRVPGAQISCYSNVSITTANFIGGDCLVAAVCPFGGLNSVRRARIELPAIVGVAPGPSSTHGQAGEGRPAHDLERRRNLRRPAAGAGRTPIAWRGLLCRCARPGHGRRDDEARQQRRRRTPPLAPARGVEPVLIR